MWFFPILYLMLIPLTKETHWLGVEGISVRSNRTWVRIPGPHICILLFFSRKSNALQQVWSIILLQISSARWPPGQIWWSKGDAHHTPKSTGTRGIAKVSQAWTRLGLKNADFTPKSGPTPLGYFFLLFIYLFVLLIIIFIITNQLNNFSS